MPSFVAERPPRPGNPGSNGRSAFGRTEMIVERPSRAARLTRGRFRPGSPPVGSCRRASRSPPVRGFRALGGAPRCDPSSPRHRAPGSAPAKIQFAEALENRNIADGAVCDHRPATMRSREGSGHAKVLFANGVRRYFDRLLRPTRRRYCRRRVQSRFIRSPPAVVVGSGLVDLNQSRG